MIDIVRNRLFIAKKELMSYNGVGRQVQILLNFIPVVSGGGLQNSLSFANHIAFDPRVVVLARRRSQIVESFRSRGFRVISVPNSRLMRFPSELVISMIYPKGVLCLTLFGPRLLGSRGRLYNICGFAYSNILYPEIPFWSWGNRVFRLSKYWIDRYRRWSAVTADELILETETMLRRARKAPDFACRELHFVPMAVTSSFDLETELRPMHEILIAAKREAGLQLVLYLASPHPNKRLHLLPEILAKDESGRLCFIITVPKGHWYTKEVLALARRLGVENRLINLGPIKPGEVGHLVGKVDALINIALLESFSNNWVEAWAKERCLVVTDAEWTRASCGDAAIYIDPGCASESACQITTSLGDAAIVESFRRAGARLLLNYPSSVEKTALTLEILNQHLAVPLKATPA